MADYQTRYDKAHRLKEVRQLLIEGWTDRQIVVDCADRWKCSQATVYRYLQQERKQITNMWGKLERRQMRAMALEMRAQIYQKATAEGDHATALRALDSRDRLAGMFDRSPEDDGL